MPWIQRQRVLSDARIAMRKAHRRGMLILAATVILALAALYIVNQRRNLAVARQKEKEAHDRRELNSKDQAFAALSQTVIAYEKRLVVVDPAAHQEKVSDAVKDKEGITSDTETRTQLEPDAPGADAPPPPPADSSHATDFVTDKIFVHKAVVWTGHYSGPQFVAFPGTPNSFLITASGDKTAGVWDLKSDKDFLLLGHTGEVNGAIFNPKTHADGSGWLAATASDDKTAALWKASAADKLLFLKGHTAAVTGLAWSGDGNWLVTTSKDQQVRIWNIAANDPSREPRVLTGHSGSVWQPCLVENGGNGWLVTPSNDKTARLWTFPQGEPVHFSGSANAEPGVLRHGSAVRRAAMDSQGRWIVTAGADGHAILWDRVTGKQLLFINHEKPVRDVTFKPGGTLFVTASADGTAQVWDAKENLGIVTLQGHTAPVVSARFTPYGPGVVTVSWDRTARLWNYESRTCVAVLRGHGDVLWSVEFSPGGTSFTTTSGDGTARLWDLNRIPGGTAFLPPPSAAK